MNKWKWNGLQHILVGVNMIRSNTSNRYAIWVLFGAIWLSGCHEYAPSLSSTASSSNVSSSNGSGGALNKTSGMNKLPTELTNRISKLINANSLNNFSKAKKTKNSEPNASGADTTVFLGAIPSTTGVYISAYYENCPNLSPRADLLTSSDGSTFYFHNRCYITRPDASHYPGSFCEFRYPMDDSTLLVSNIYINIAKATSDCTAYGDFAGLSPFYDAFNSTSGYYFLNLANPSSPYIAEDPNYTDTQRARMVSINKADYLAKIDPYGGATYEFYSKRATKGVFGNLPPGKLSNSIQTHNGAAFMTAQFYAGTNYFTDAPCGGQGFYNPTQSGSTCSCTATACDPYPVAAVPDTMTCDGTSSKYPSPCTVANSTFEVSEHRMNNWDYGNSPPTAFSSAAPPPNPSGYIGPYNINDSYMSDKTFLWQKVTANDSFLEYNVSLRDDNLMPANNPSLPAQESSIMAPAITLSNQFRRFYYPDGTNVKSVDIPANVSGVDGTYDASGNYTSKNYSFFTPTSWDSPAWISFENTAGGLDVMRSDYVTLAAFYDETTLKPAIDQSTSPGMGVAEVAGYHTIMPINVIYLKFRPTKRYFMKYALFPYRYDEKITSRFGTMSVKDTIQKLYNEYSASSQISQANSPQTQPSSSSSITGATPSKPAGTAGTPTQISPNGTTNTTIPPSPTSSPSPKPSPSPSPSPGPSSTPPTSWTAQASDNTYNTTTTNSTVSVYRYTCKGAACGTPSDHYFALAKATTQAANWYYEREAFEVFTSTASTRHQLYSCISNSTGHHEVTTNFSNCKASDTASLGFIEAAATATATVPLYRCGNSSTGDAIVLTAPDGGSTAYECSGLSSLGYTQGSTPLGWVAPAVFYPWTDNGPTAHYRTLSGDCIMINQDRYWIRSGCSQNTYSTGSGLGYLWNLWGSSASVANGEILPWSHNGPTTVTQLVLNGTQSVYIYNNSSYSDGHAYVWSSSTDSGSWASLQLSTSVSPFTAATPSSLGAYWPKSDGSGAGTLGNSIYPWSQGGPTVVYEKLNGDYQMMNYGLYWDAATPSTPAAISAVSQWAKAAQTSDGTTIFTDAGPRIVYQKPDDSRVVINRGYLWYMKADRTWNTDLDSNGKTYPYSVKDFFFSVNTTVGVNR